MASDSSDTRTAFHPTSGLWLNIIETSSGSSLARPSAEAASLLWDARLLGCLKRGAHDQSPGPLPSHRSGHDTCRRAIVGHTHRYSERGRGPFPSRWTARCPGALLVLEGLY